MNEIAGDRIKARLTEFLGKPRFFMISPVFNGRVLDRPFPRSRGATNVLVFGKISLVFSAIDWMVDSFYQILIVLLIFGYTGIIW